MKWQKGLTAHRELSVVYATKANYLDLKLVVLGESKPMK